MDRPPHQRHLQTDPFAKPDRGLAIGETEVWSDPWDPGASPEEASIPKSTYDIRELLLKRREEVTSSTGVSVPDAPTRFAIASRVWAKVQSRLPLDRRVVAGLGLLGVAGVLLIGLSRYNVAPSIKTMSGTTYNTAVAGLTSAVNAALDLVGKGPAAPATTEDVALVSKKKAPSVRAATAKGGPLASSRALQLMPLVSAETVQANGPAPIDSADVNAAMVAGSKEALALPPNDSVVETSVTYSPNDTDVNPPIAIRSPGIATDLDLGNPNVSLIEILVSEIGRVESAKVRRRPATLGATLQSAAAVSVVKTWRFWPARKNGQPVKYRTTVPVETVYPAGTTDGTR